MEKKDISVFGLAFSWREQALSYVTGVGVYGRGSV